MPPKTIHVFLQSSAVKLLLAVIESRRDSDNAERILQNMTVEKLVDIIVGYYHVADVNAGLVTTGSSGPDDSPPLTPREVGHSLYILAHQLSPYSPALEELLKLSAGQTNLRNEALSHYQSQTATIEVKFLFHSFFIFIYSSSTSSIHFLLWRSFSIMEVFFCFLLWRSFSIFYYGDLFLFWRSFSIFYYGGLFLLRRSFSIMEIFSLHPFWLGYVIFTFFFFIANLYIILRSHLFTWCP